VSDSFLSLENLSKRFAEHLAVDDLSLSVPQGELLALLGPSGSGKTTTLRLLAGFESPDSGRVVVDGQDVTSRGPADRKVGMVFQHYALFPHMTVAENVGFGLSDMTKHDQNKRVSQVLAQVHMGPLADRPVTDLSGGQQQRVAVARALAPRPGVLLLDEPLSNLDPTLREATRIELRDSLKEVGITSVFVTHEQEEAFALGDQVAVLRDGKLEQVGPAPELYEKPASLFVSTFVGRGSVVPGTVSEGETITVSTGVVWPAQSSVSLQPGAPASAVVRPENLRFTDGAGLGGEIGRVRYSGARAFFIVDTEIGAVEVEASVHSGKVGDRVKVEADWAHVFPDANE
jgi:putative spermidine/putrescine transport system ATP-binding protein